MKKPEVENLVSDSLVTAAPGGHTVAVVSVLSNTARGPRLLLARQHRLNMELDLQSLFRLHLT
jgi:hypothetical protein